MFSNVNRPQSKSKYWMILKNQYLLLISQNFGLLRTPILILFRFGILYKLYISLIPSNCIWGTIEKNELENGVLSCACKKFFQFWKSFFFFNFLFLLAIHCLVTIQTKSEILGMMLPWRMWNYLSVFLLLCSLYLKDYKKVFLNLQRVKFHCFTITKP